MAPGWFFLVLWNLVSMVNFARLFANDNMHPCLTLRILLVPRGGTLTICSSGQPAKPTNYRLGSWSCSPSSLCTKLLAVLGMAKGKKTPKRFWKRWKNQWTYLILSQLGLVAVFFLTIHDVFNNRFCCLCFVCIVPSGHLLCCGHLLGGQLGSWWSNLYLFRRRKLFSVIRVCGCYCERATFLPAG